MSTQWTNMAGGDWTVGSNWSALTPPTASEDATLGVLSLSYTVTLTASGAANSLTLANSTVTLAVSTTSGSSPASLAVQGDLSNAGSLYVDTSSFQGGSTLTVGGTLTNTYSIYIGNGNLPAATTVAAAGLVNSGSIYLYGGSGTDTNRTTLDISGAASPASNAGFLELASEATVRTQGDFTNTGTLYVDATYYTAGSDLAIGGTLSNAGYLYIGANYASAGSTMVSAAELANAGGITLAGGTGTSTYKATLDITSGTAPSLLTGTFNLSGHSLVEFAGGSIAGIANGANLYLGGANAFVADATALGGNSALSGLAGNAGTLELDSGAAIRTTGDFSNNGTLYVDVYGYPSYSTSGGSSLAIGGTLSNTATLQIGSGYEILSGSTVSAAGLANTGAIALAGGTGSNTNQATLDITAQTAPSLLTGTFNLSGHSLVEFAGGSIAGIANGANLYLGGANAVVADATAPGGNSALSGLAGNAGTLELDSGAAIRTTGDFSNDGTLYVDVYGYPSYSTSGGSSLAIGGTLSNTATLQIGSGYEILSGSTVSAAGLANTGAIALAGGTGSNTNQATLDITAQTAPSLLTGTFNLSGHSLVEFAGGSIAGIANGANLYLGGANAFVADATALGGNSALSGLAGNAGTLELDSGAAIRTTGDFSNNGTLYVDVYGYPSYSTSGGSSLAIGGTLSNTATLQIGSGYEILSGSTVSAAGLANTGAIALAGGTGSNTNQATLDITAQTAPSLLTGTFNLSGHSLVEFAGGSIAGIANGANLYLGGANAVVADATAPGGNSALSGLAGNAGTLELDSGAAIRTTGDFSNNGTLYVDVYGYPSYSTSGGSSLAIGGTLSNTATLQIGSGYEILSGSTVSAAGLANTGAIALAGGTGSNTNQATLDITAQTAPSLLTGTFNLSGHSLVEFAGGSIAGIANGANLYLGGANAVVADATAPGGNSALSGLAGNAGTLELDSGAAIRTTGDFSNNGTLYVDVYGYPSYSTSGGSSLAIGGTLSNTATLQIGSGYEILSGSTVSAAGLANTGAIALAGGTGSNTNQATLDITAQTAPSLLTGTFNLSGHSLVEFAGGSIAGIANGANLYLGGANAFVADATALGGNSALSGLAGNAGTLELDSGAAIRTTGDFSNNGTLYVDVYGYPSYSTSGGSSLAIGGTLSNTATLQIGSGYEILSGSTVSAAGLANTGAIALAGGTGSNTNQATLDITAQTAPSLLTGTFNLSGHSLVEFAGGSIAGIANGANLYLGGANAVVADATAPGGNSALSGLAGNAGTLELDSGAAIRTTGDFSNNGTLYVDVYGYPSYSTSGGSSLAIGGTLSNTSNLGIGNTGLTASTTVSAAALTNAGSISLTGGTGTAANQAALDITGRATDNGSIAIYGNAVLNAASLTVANGGTVTLTSGGTTSGVSIGASGREIVASGGITVAPTIAGGILELAGGTVSGGGIAFAGNGTLQIDGNTMPANAISGFAAGDAIDLRVLTFGSTTTASYDSATGALTVSGGAVPDTLTLSGIPAGAGFAVANDGIGGTLVTVMPPAGPGTQWSNTSGGDWTVAGNWSGGVPTSATDAVLGVPGGYTVSLTAGGATNSLTIDHAGVNLSLATSSGGGASLAIQADLTNRGGLYVDTGNGLGGSTLSVGGTLSTADYLQIGNANPLAATTVSATAVANAGSLYLVGGSIAGPSLDVTADFSNIAYVYIDNSAGEGNSRLNIGGPLANTNYLYIGNSTLAAATTVTAAALANTGTITLTGGTSTTQATLDITSGTAPSVLTGTYNLSGHALLEFAGGSIASIANTARLTLNGIDAFVADAATTTSNSALAGLASNDGYLELDSGTSIQTTGDFINNGTLYVDYLYYNTSGGSALTAGGTLTNAGTLYIGQYANQTGAGSTVSAAALTNTGTIILTGGTSTTQATLDITSGTAPSLLTGTFNLSGHSLVEFAGGSIAGIANGANLYLGGANAFVADATALGGNSALSGLAGNAGTLELDSGAAIRTTGDFSNNGTLYVDVYGYPSYSTSGGSSLAIGGTLSNTATLQIGSGYEILSGSTVSAAGLANTGAIALAGGTGSNTNQATLDITAQTAPSLLTGTFNLSGHSLVEFAGGSIAGIANGANLYLGGANAFVADATALGGNSALSGLAGNAGTLELDSGAAIRTTGDFSNNGTLYVDVYGYPSYSTSGGSSLAIGGTLSNTATLQIGSGYEILSGSTVSAAGLANTGAIALAGGTGSNTNQATLDITAQTAPSLLTGTFNLSGHSLVEFAGGSIASIANTARLTLNGINAFVADAAATTSNSALAGLASNDGYLELDSGTSIQTTGDFINNGTLYVDYLYYNTSGGSALTAGGTLTNAGTLYIGQYANQTGAGSTVSAAALANTGTIILTGGTSTTQATLDITSGTAPSVLTGTYNLSGHALLEFAGGSIASIANTARLTLNGINAFVADAAATTSNSALAGLASNDGYLELDSGTSIQTTGDFINNGTLYVDYLYYNTSGGSALTAGGTLTNAGTLYIGQYANQTGAGSTVSAAALANTGTIILTGGTSTTQATLDITSGTATDRGTIYLYGNTVISAGSLTIANGGTLSLNSGGTATGAIVGSGGHEYVYSGGVSMDATIDGGILELAGGTVAAATIDFTFNAGVLQIDSTAMPSNTIRGFRHGDVIDLRSATFDSAATGIIAAGNVLTVSGGGSTYTLQLDPLHNYMSAAVILTSDGAGGTDVAVTGPPIFVSSGQTLTISPGATYDNVNVLNGGTLVVLSGGTATDSIDSGSEVLSGVDFNAVVGGTGTLTVAAGGVASAATVSTLGQITVASGGSAGDATIAGGTLDLMSGAIARGTVVFTGTGGTLEIDDSTMPTNPIAGFAVGDTIDLRALVWSSTNSVSFNSVANSLTVTGGGTTDILTVTGIPAGTQFSVTSDGFGGTKVGTFQNNGTLTGSYLDGVVLTHNPTILTSTGYITNQTAAYGGDAVYGGSAVGWIFTNQGTIDATRPGSVGISLAGGGSVTNAAGGLIEGEYDGVRVVGGAGIVSNRGTIAGNGTFTDGVALFSGGSVTNGLSANATALIAGAGRRGVFIYGGAGTVTNFGTVEGSSTYVAVYLKSGGRVTNELGGLILGPSYVGGIAIGHGIGTVVNHGSINGVFLEVGGAVANFGELAAAQSPVKIGGGTGTVSNYGTIIATGTSSIGVDLLAGGTVENHGTIRASGANFTTGVYIAAGGTVTNDGTIGATGIGVHLAAGGSVTNGAIGAANALITAGLNAIDFGSGNGTLVNFGTLASTGAGFGVYGQGVVGVANYGRITGAQGVDFAFGGTVTNGSASLTGASISGYYEGVRIDGSLGVVTNFGSVAGGATSGDGVLLLAGGSVTNVQTGVIYGPATGISVAGTTGTVVNYGTISASGAGYPTGVYLAPAGIVRNSGTIIAANGTNGTAVSLANGGTILNNTGGLLEGGDRGIGIGGTAGVGSIANYGTISGGNDGIDLGVAGAVRNYGTIAAGRYGIYLTAGGSATNAAFGLIAAYKGVLATYVAATVTNYGTIAGSGSNGIGVELTFGGSTLTNAGTIVGAGGYAVMLAGANNRLIIDPGAVFAGSVYGGGGGNDVLELAAGTLAATGTIDGSPGRYPGFDHFTVNASAKWLLTGLTSLAPGSTLSDAGTLTVAASLAVVGSLVDTGVMEIGAGAVLALANGADGTGSIAFAGSGGTLEIGGTTMPVATITISGFTPGETIDLRGVAGGNAGGATLGAGNLLTVFEGGNSFALQLDPAQSFGGFAVVADGSGGTDILSLAPVVVSAGVPFVVPAGETLIGVLVESGGILEVGSGAKVFGTQISSGGSETVDSGGFDSGTLVFGGGSQIVAFGGTALDTVLDGAATQTVLGSAGSTTVSSGDTQIVASGGIASATTILSGGTELVQSGGLTVDTVIAGGTLDLNAGAAASGRIGFAGISGGVLQLDSNTMPAATISGFAIGDAIDLRALPSNPADSVSFNSATGALTVSGSTIDTLTLSGVASGTAFALANDGAGGTLVQEIVRPPPSLFDFVFTYNDGTNFPDYYYGTVADDGTFGYRVGQTITALPGISLAGHYDIFAEEGLATNRAVGTVQVVDYSHGGPGVASPTPLGFPGTDGTNGLGSESDMVLGTDGQPHPFGPTTTPLDGELSFPTADLYGFVFSYADGAAFYSGTVAVTTGTTPVIPVGAGLRGSYSFFAEGVTARVAGTVVVNRFTVGDVSFIPNSGGAIDGTGGLGSETASITVNGTTLGFGDQLEPALTLIVPSVPTTPPPGTSAVIAAEVAEIYSEVLDRAPTSAELANDSTALANGASLSSIRATLAGSAEAQRDLGALYRLPPGGAGNVTPTVQIFDRPATAGDLSADTQLLIDGSSLQTVQLMLAQSPEAQTDIATIYSEVFGPSRAVSGSELTADMVQIGNDSAAAVADPNGRSGVDGVRDIVAHSTEAQNDLVTLFQAVFGSTSTPTAAQLVGMEDQLSKPGVSLTTLATALSSSGAAAAGTTIAAGAGNATLTATPGIPTLFDFSNLGFGNDTIAGFDPIRDTIELPHALVANLTTLLQQDITATAGGGTLITLNSSQSIVLSGIAPASLGQTNFLLV